MTDIKTDEDKKQNFGNSRNILNNNYKNDFEQKRFQSKYINNSGKWTQQAVNDGFVDFKDYISDIKNVTENHPSFNNKSFKISNIKQVPVKNNNFLSAGYKVDEEHPGEMYAGLNSVKDSGKKVYNKAKKSVKNAISTTNDVINQAKTYMDMGGEVSWISTHHGKNAAIKYAEYSNKYIKMAGDISKDWGISGAEDNKADAYRHFVWNAKMTRDSELGYYTTRDLTNYHEYDTIKDLGWIQKDSDKFNYLQDNTIIKCKMNQPTLMDLWNNQVGRELANNKVFSEMDIDSLFDMAYNNNWLITDASKTYEFLGITDYITNDYTVDVEWNLTTGNIKVKKGDKYVDLKIGV